MPQPNNTNPKPQPKTEEPWTVGRLIRWVDEDLRSRGIESPRLEAELLLAEALGCDRVRLVIERDQVVEEEALGRFRSFVQRRRKREPVAYLLGRREFYGHSFKVDRRVLVPRPDTETLVEAVLRRTQSDSMFGRLLDLCTGSGNVALAFACERPTWQVEGTDLSEEAIAVARDNAMRLGTLWSVRFRVGDLFEAVAPEARYDVIAANPPYIPSAEIDTLAPDIREHEPRLALDGGPEGLAVIRRIVACAPSHLLAQGLLALEIALDQADAVRALLEQAGFEQVEVDRDLGGRARVVSARLSALPSSPRT